MNNKWFPDNKFPNYWCSNEAGLNVFDFFETWQRLLNCEAFFLNHFSEKLP